MICQNKFIHVQQVFQFLTAGDVIISILKLLLRNTFIPHLNVNKILKINSNLSLIK
jgi:hypothetical protein